MVAVPTLQLQVDFMIPPVMNSTSTYLRAKIGGFKGRNLQAKDQIPIHTPKQTFHPNDERVSICYRKQTIIGSKVDDSE